MNVAERIAGTLDWKEFLVILPHPEWHNLRLVRPRMLDLILSKMGRGDAKDLDDVVQMLSLEMVGYDTVAEGARRADIPAAYADIFPAARDRILAIVREHP